MSVFFHLAFSLWTWNPWMHDLILRWPYGNEICPGLWYCLSVIIDSMFSNCNCVLIWKNNGVIHPPTTRERDAILSSPSLDRLALFVAFSFQAHSTWWRELTPSDSLYIWTLETEEPVSPWLPSLEIYKSCRGRRLLINLSSLHGDLHPSGWAMWSKVTGKFREH